MRSEVRTLQPGEQSTVTKKGSLAEDDDVSSGADAAETDDETSEAGFIVPTYDKKKGCPSPLYDWKKKDCCCGGNCCWGRCTRQELRKSCLVGVAKEGQWHWVASARAYQVRIPAGRSKEDKVRTMVPSVPKKGCPGDLYSWRGQDCCCGGGCCWGKCTKRLLLNKCKAGIAKDGKWIWIKVERSWQLRVLAPSSRKSVSTYVPGYPSGTGCPKPLYDWNKKDCCCGAYCCWGRCTRKKLREKCQVGIAKHGKWHFVKSAKAYQLRIPK